MLLSLPNSDIVSDIVAEVGSQLSPGAVVVDTTTGEPAAMVRHGRQLAERDVHYVEATVAGSSRQLREGESVMFLAGDAGQIESRAWLFETLTPHRFYLGSAGQAARFKLVHNLVLGLHRAVLAEALSFAGALGFDLPRTLEVLMQTPAASQVMTSKGEKMLQGDYSPQATLSQHLKDVRLIIQAAREAGVEVPLF